MRWALWIGFAGLCACSAKLSPAETDAVASDASPVDLVCPVGRLPVNGTACDGARMGVDFCRLADCGWGCEDECICKDGAWFCAGSCRDAYGCGTPPLCHPKTTLTCPGEDAGSDASCGARIALEASGPWDAAKSCWINGRHTFECVDGIDGGAAITCFVQLSTGLYWLADSTHIPSGPDFRYCSEAERAAHPSVGCK